MTQSKILLFDCKTRGRFYIYPFTCDSLVFRAKATVWYLARMATSGVITLKKWIPHWTLLVSTFRGTDNGIQPFSENQSSTFGTLLQVGNKLLLQKFPFLEVLRYSASNFPSMWPDVKIKCSPKFFDKSFPKSSHRSVAWKVMFYNCPKSHHKFGLLQ